MSSGPLDKSQPNYVSHPLLRWVFLFGLLWFSACASNSGSSGSESSLESIQAEKERGDAGGTVDSETTTQPEQKPIDTATSKPPPKPSQTVFGGLRPVTLQVPSAYDGRKPYALMLLLHGYGASGSVQLFYLNLKSLQSQHDVLIAAPDGTLNSGGKRFWNATPACCDFGRTGVDDVAYLSAVIKDISKVYNVDSKKVYLVGHSNGGFMAYRMACDASHLVTAVVSIAGATFNTKERCKPTTPVSVLQIHGSAKTLNSLESR